MDSQALDTLQAFFSAYRKLSFKKGETLLRFDDVPQGVYFLTKGYIRIISISKDGEELTLLILKAYDFFPVRWAITNEEVRYSYEALTPVEAYRAPKSVFLSFLHEHPDIFYAFSEKIFLRLGGLMKRIEYLVFGTSENKVASVIQMCGEYFGEKKGNRVDIDLPLTHREIASLVGMTRETVTHAIDDLKRKGIISIENKHVVIMNSQALAQESQLQNV
jgi:CRP-like cAMP-binding protein